jgi:mannose-6-phosphate isomerase-like protein (cupin superfamily)
LFTQIWSLEEPMTVDGHPIVYGPDAGAAVALGGIGVCFKVPAAATGGAFSIVEHPVRPGTLAPPHVHADEDELSYVLEGTFGVRVGDDVIEAGPGSYVVKPRGVPHTFWNAGPAPARLIEIIAPAGFERYFTEMADLLQRHGPDFDRISDLAAGYHLSFRMDWVDDLVARYGVTLLGEGRAES